MTGPRLARLDTPRLILDPLSVEVARALVDGEPAPFPTAPGWPHDDTLVALRMTVQAGWPSWLVRLRAPGGGDGPDPGPVIGECGLKGWPDASGTVEIGYGLAGPQRGRGYGTELVAAVVGWLPQIGTRQVLAEVAVGNVPSRRLVERIGFTVQRVAAGFVYYQRTLGG